MSTKLSQESVSQAFSAFKTFLGIQPAVASSEFDFEKKEYPLLAEQWCESAELIEYESLNAFLESDSVPQVTQDSLAEFVSNFKSEEFVSNSVASAVEHNQIQCTLSHLDAAAICNTSFHSSVVNLLKFDYPGGHFFVFQYVSSYDAIYFPEFKLFLLTGHGSKVLFFTELVKAFFFQLNAGDLDKPKTFGGVLTAHGRPSHTFYDCLPAMFHLHRKKLLKKIPAFVQLEGYDYVQLPAVFSEISSVRSVTLKPAEFSKRMAAEGSFYFHVGLLFKQRLHLKLVNAFDKHVVKSALNQPFDAVKFKGIDDTLLIWFGVTSQKRSWIEQVDACAAFVNHLAAQYSDVALVVDGWTNPHSPRALDIEESASDRKLIEQIQSKLAKNIPVYSVIGETPFTKLQVAKRVAFFIANQMTGSMLVSRFCERPGITHMSQAFFKDSAAQSVNKHAIAYPIEKVKDAVEDLDKRMDQVSYSIAVPDFVEFAEGVFKKQFSSIQAYLSKQDLVSSTKTAFDLLTKLEPKKDLVPDQEAAYWRSTGDDPIFMVNPTLLPLIKPDTYDFNVALDFKSLAPKKKGRVFSKVYIDYGQGYSEQQALIVELKEGVGSAKFEVNGNVIGVRFDPTDCEAVFKMNRLQIVRC
ncbi:hypothetical protein DN062_02755 [Nitrincola tibetensis]|uniref:Uncharacterized protein n=1 Tax=Nitrincola tibetensis TaxID=2219697 RepID=A0A364NQ46_9GAMM|nr:hypothetical protein [Nitrincola tibetensis]RAU19206.1 hypothetical protein DN062_02755 [Nitrincola tibetensis]